VLGTVTTLHRYPVKSMLGEEVAASDVGYRGLARDRRLAVVSRRTGKVASAKYPRLSRRSTCSPPRRSTASKNSAHTGWPTWSATGPTSSSGPTPEASPRTTGSAGTCASATP
jgi:hypothetical protein